jgi:phosphohistidine phosphatase SixA
VKTLQVRKGKSGEKWGFWEGWGIAGKDQLQTLARALEPILTGRVLLLTSTAPRAEQSALALMESAPAIRKLETHAVLWSDNRHPEDMEAVLALVQEKQDHCDVLLLMTHHEYMRDFPAHYMKQCCHLEAPRQERDKGTAIVISHCNGETPKMTHYSGANTMDVPLTPIAPSTQTFDPTERHEDKEQYRPDAVRVTSNQARKYLRKIWYLADPKKICTTHLFGSCATGAGGGDADVILEVPTDVFVGFMTNCVGALDGFHPVEKFMIGGYSAFWDYHSPADARLEYALHAIGIEEEDMKTLAAIIPFENVDILCLPAGWNKEGDVVNSLLQEHHGLSMQDPNMLSKVMSTAIEVGDEIP